MSEFAHEYELDFLPADTRITLDTEVGLLSRVRLFVFAEDNDHQVRLTPFESLFVKVLLDRAPLPVPAQEMVQALIGMHGAADDDMLIATVRVTLSSADSKTRYLGLAISYVLDTGYVLHAASHEE